MGLIQNQYDDLRKKVKKSELENQWRAFKETRHRQKENLPLMDDIEKIKEAGETNSVGVIGELGSSSKGDLPYGGRISLE